MLHVTIPRMKTSLLLGMALGTLLVTTAASAAKTTYTAEMSGANQLPPVAGEAAGVAILTVDDVANTICGTITYSGLSGENAAPTAMHIHTGDAKTASGNVLVPLPTGASPVKVNLTGVATDKIAALKANEHYVNVHTTANANGEIRGQLEEGGAEQSCDEATDAGTDGKDAGGSGNNSSGGTNEATTVRADAGTNTAAPAKEDDGCSTTGSSPANGLAIAFGVGIAVAAIGRSRRKR